MWKIPVWRCFAFRSQIKYYFWKWDWDKEIIKGNIFTQVVIITFGTILPNVIYLLGIGKIYNIRQDLAKSCRMLYMFNYGKIRDVDWRAYYIMRDGDHLAPESAPEIRPKISLRNSHEVRCEFDIDICWKVEKNIFWRL